MAQCTECEAEYDEALDGCPHCEAAGPLHRCERCAERYRGLAFCPACGRARETLLCDEHPDREARGVCVVCGRAVCERCSGRGSRVCLCREHRKVRVMEGWAEVYTAHSDVDAWLIQQRLRTADIEARVFSQRDRVFSVDLGALSIVRVLVPVWDYLPAREAIAAEPDAAAEPDRCAVCGEETDPRAAACLACGAGQRPPPL